MATMLIPDAVCRTGECILQSMRTCSNPIFSWINETRLYDLYGSHRFRLGYGFSL